MIDHRSNYFLQQFFLGSSRLGQRQISNMHNTFMLVHILYLTSAIVSQLQMISGSH